MDWLYVLHLTMGGVCFWSALVLSTHIILTDKDRPNYPGGSQVIRHIGAGVALLYLLLCRRMVQDNAPLSFEGVSFMVGLSILHTAMLVEHLRKWLPVRHQAWVARLVRIASCAHAREMRKARQSSNAASSGPNAITDPNLAARAMFELAQSGVTVIAPGDKVGDWINPGPRR